MPNSVNNTIFFVFVNTTAIIQYTDFWNITKRELIKKTQAAPRQITITLFIIINKIVLLDIFVQLIR